MKLGKVIGVGALSLSLLGLGACSLNPFSKPVSNQTTGGGSTNSTSEKGQSSSDMSTTNDTTSPSTSDSGTSSQSNGSDQSSSSGESRSTTQAPKPNPKPATPPKTQKEALGDIAAALQTKVPLMLPAAVPLTQGKFLTGTTLSETWYFKANFYQTVQPAIINSTAASKGVWVASVEGTEYKDEASANASINGYTKVDPTKSPNIDLGHGIMAIKNAGTGHAYLSWNEGRWSLNIDSPNDLANQNKTYPDSQKLAQDIVAYLNQNTLPSPQSIGVVTVNNWNHSYGTTITWQYHEMTYQVTSLDPFMALKVAVAMHSMSK